LYLSLLLGAGAMHLKINQFTPSSEDYPHPQSTKSALHLSLPLSRSVVEDAHWVQTQSWMANPNYDLNDFMMDYDWHRKSRVCHIIPSGYSSIREFVSYSWTANPNYDLNDILKDYD
jgi:hypothetical protein